jgi:hypothetical protein
MNYIHYITSITSITAIIALFIAWRQASIAKAKLRLDLYNKRFDIYTNAVKLLHVTEALEHNKPISEKFDETYRRFIISFRESKFLFNKEIYDILAVISDSAFKIAHYKEKSSQLNNSLPPPSLIFADENIKNQKTLYESIELLERCMEKYLNFHTLDGV